MERALSFSDVQRAVLDAYEQFKSLKQGTVDPRVAAESKAGTFGISLMLTDGRTAEKGDTAVKAPLGTVMKVPLSVVLLTQKGADGLAKKACCCHCKKEGKKSDLPFGLHALRAVSAVEPQGDPDGKFGVVADTIDALADTDHGFSDSIYRRLAEDAKKVGMAKYIQEIGYELSDDKAQAMDVCERLLAVQLSTDELATLGATIAADGRNPKTGEYVFDGTIAAPVVALMSTRGKHFIKPWMVATGVPAKKSFTGMMLAVMPGFGAIAAYSPEVDENGVPVKAAKAIAYIAQKLGLNVFASARVRVDK